MISRKRQRGPVAVWCSTCGKVDTHTADCPQRPLLPFQSKPVRMLTLPARWPFPPSL